MHCGLRPAHFVRCGAADAQQTWKLLDFTSATREGAPACGRPAPAAAFQAPEFIELVSGNKVKARRLVGFAEGADGAPCRSLDGGALDFEPCAASPAVDVWSLGCIFYQLFHANGGALFGARRADAGLDDDQLVALAQWGAKPARDAIMRPAAIADDEARDLLSKMLATADARLASVDDVLAHAFFAAHDDGDTVEGGSSYDASKDAAAGGMRAAKGPSLEETRGAAMDEMNAQLAEMAAELARSKAANATLNLELASKSEKTTKSSGCLMM